MDSSADLLLLTNPQAFMEVVTEHSAEERVKKLRTLDDMMT